MTLGFLGILLTTKSGKLTTDREDIMIVVLGSTGMNGHTVTKHMVDVFGEENVKRSTRRTPTKAGEFFFEVTEYPTEYHYCVIPECDYVINCIGVIKPHITKNMQISIAANALFPYQLANHCEKYGYKLINITTDCVFSGKTGDYTEESLHDCTDEYGKTKSLGEPPNCLNLRTSIIGPEIEGRATSLVEVVKSKKGGDFNAFTNWYWNGVTTLQYAKICQQIIEQGLHQNGTFHVFSDKIVKGDMIKILNDKYDLGLNITRCEAPYYCDRTLSTVKRLCGMLQIPSIRRQMEDM